DFRPTSGHLLDNRLVVAGSRAVVIDDAPCRMPDGWPAYRVQLADGVERSIVLVPIDLVRLKNPGPRPVAPVPAAPVPADLGREPPPRTEVVSEIRVEYDKFRDQTSMALVLGRFENAAGTHVLAILAEHPGREPRSVSTIRLIVYRGGP